MEPKVYSLSENQIHLEQKNGNNIINNKLNYAKKYYKIYRGYQSF